MIEAMVFDLDGTLIQTEKLKAISYAKAVRDLCLCAVTQEHVLTAFSEVVGRSREQVAQSLVERFALAGSARLFMDESGVRTPWQAFVQIRLKHCEAMLANPEVIQADR